MSATGDELDDLALGDASGELSISDDDQAQAAADLDAVEGAAGGFGGGLSDPSSWAEAINGAKEQWFSMFDRQRSHQASACYQLAFLLETWRRWFTGRRGEGARAALDALDVQLARSVWEGTAWREAVAAVVAGRIRSQVWASCPDFDSLRRVESLRTKLPQVDRVGTSTPSAYLQAGQCGFPVTNSGRNRYLMVGTGLFYDRKNKELFGPELPGLYELAGDDVDPVAVAPELAARVAALRSVVEGYDEAQARVLELFEQTRQGCERERAAALDAVAQVGGFGPSHGTGNAPTFQGGASSSSSGSALLILGGLGLGAWLLWSE